MWAWMKKFRRQQAPPPPSDLDVAKAQLAAATVKFDLALAEYRTGMIKLECRRADEEQRQHIRASRYT